MDIIKFLYCVVIVMLATCIFMIVKEGARLRWTRLARWIAVRMVGVCAGIIIMAVAVLLFTGETDPFMRGIISLAFLAMSVLFGMHLPEILWGMSDENLAEDLNIKEYDHSGDEDEITL